jgi:hypothetical protein
MAESLEDNLQAYFREQQSVGLVSAYLFGSQTEGRAHRESDVDVGVLLDRACYPDAEDRFGLRVRLGSALIGLLHRNEVDVVVLNDAPPLLGRRIVNEGRRVYCQDAERYKDFRRDVQSRAADLAPFLVRMRKVKLRDAQRMLVERLLELRTHFGTSACDPAGVPRGSGSGSGHLPEKRCPPLPPDRVSGRNRHRRRAVRS